jgi:hypothetical protein
MEDRGHGQVVHLSQIKVQENTTLFFFFIKTSAGSGSTGATFLGLPDPDPLVSGIDPNPSIVLLSPSKKSKKTSIPTVL